jgi:fatty-acid desaturase
MPTIDRRYALTAWQLIGPIISIWALYTYFSWSWIVIALVMFFLMRCIGGVITYHRILSHNTHTMHPVVEFIGTGLGLYGSFTSPIEYCAVHTNHHKFVDTNKDAHPHSLIGWKTLFPLLWINSGPDSGDVRTVVKLRRNKIAVFYYKYYWYILALPLLLLILTPQCFLYLFVIPSTASVWSASYSTFNHDETGPVDRGFWFGILTCGEHKHVWHHNNPYDTSGEGWLDIVINLVAKKNLKNEGKKINEFSI